MKVYWFISQLFSGLPIVTITSIILDNVYDNYLNNSPLLKVMSIYIYR